jgi:hypothetical protein
VVPVDASGPEREVTARCLAVIAERALAHA